MKIDKAKFGETLAYFTKGYEQDVAELMKGSPSKLKGEVVFRNLPFHSLCEHHLLPFYGEVSIAYLPNGQLVGLSRMQKLVQALGLRLQLQEKLTEQIAQAVQTTLKPKGVAVFIEGVHFCSLVGDGKMTELETTAFTGAYEKSALKQKTFLLRQEAKRGKK